MRRGRMGGAGFLLVLALFFCSSVNADLLDDILERGTIRVGVAEFVPWTMKTRSGELIFMVILGGSAYLFGPLLGAVVFLLLEEILSGFTIYWHLPFGIFLILSVLFMRGGLSGFLGRWTQHND